jgi:hypothetical protein
MSKIRNLVYLVVIGMLVGECMIEAPVTPLPVKSSMAAKATVSIRPATTTATLSQPPTGTPTPLPPMDPPLQAAVKLCEKVLPRQVCLAG